MRISITKIDAYKYCIDNEISVKNTIDRLTKYKPNIAMSKGSALHAILEKPKRYQILTEQSNTRYSYFCTDMNTDITFDANNIELLFKHRPNDAIWEVKDTIEQQGVTLVGKIDALLASIGYEFKTTVNTKDLFERYSNSLQWKFYTYLFGLSQVEYHIFGMDKNRDKITSHNKKVFVAGNVDILKSEVTRWLNDFLGFVERHNLQEFFQYKKAA